METTYREMVIRRITQMPAEQVWKVLIFMAGMEAERKIYTKIFVSDSAKQTTSPGIPP